MRYVTILALASMSVMTGVAFVLEWREIFAVLAVISVILIGLPVLSLASNFWFGEMPPQSAADRGEAREVRTWLRQ